MKIFQVMNPGGHYRRLGLCAVSLLHAARCVALAGDASFSSRAAFPRWNGPQRENSVQAVTQEAFRETAVFTELAFGRLLEWLDDGVDSHGETYVEMRRRLVSYFDRRNRLSADELADETLSRIARTLEKDGQIATRPPARYCYVVAKYVLLEDIRRERPRVSLDETRSLRVRSATLSEPDEGQAAEEERFECFETCLQKLKPEQRELIVEYYRDTRREKIERRRDLAKRLGISMNALGIRASRIRSTLEACVEASAHDK